MKSLTKHLCFTRFAVLTALLLNLSTSANAGHWERERYVWNGTKTNAYIYYQQVPVPNPAVRGYQIKKETYTERNGVRVSQGTYGSVASTSVSWQDRNPMEGLTLKQAAPPPGSSSYVSSSVYAVMKWHRNRIYSNVDQTMIDDPDDNPPQYIYVVETLSLAAGKGVFFYGGTKPDYDGENATQWPGNYVAISGNIGNGKTSCAFNPADWVYSRTYDAIGASYGYSAFYTKSNVRQVKVPGDIVNIPAARVGGNVDVSTGYHVVGGQGTGSISFSYGAEPIDRAITINRNGARGPVKMFNDSTLDESRDEWIGSDGVRHGHTVYSQLVADAGGIEGTHTETNLQIFSVGFAPPLGTPYPQGWNSIYDASLEASVPKGTWNWSPTSGDDTPYTHRQEMPPGTTVRRGSGVLSYDPPFSGISSKAITYNLTDTDGIKGRGVYELKLHDPYEVKTHNVVANKQFNVRPHPHGDMATSSNGAEVQVTCTKSYDLTISGSFGIEPAKIMGKLLGFEFGASVTRSIGTETSYSSGPINAGYGTYLEIYELYDEHSGIANQWDSGGWVGEKPFYFTIPSKPKDFGAQAHVPHILINPPGGTPGGSG